MNQCHRIVKKKVVTHLPLTHFIQCVNNQQLYPSNILPHTYIKHHSVEGGSYSLNNEIDFLLKLSLIL